MRSRCILLALSGLTIGLLLVAGCGKVKQAREAAQAVRAGQEMARSGKTTVTDEKGNKVTIEASKAKEGEGSWSVTDKEGKTTTASVSSNVTESDVGLKFYPGAEVKSGSKVSTTGEKAGATATAMLLTKDPMDKVVKFYKNAYAKGNQVVETPESTLIMIEGGAGGGKMITITKDNASGGVMISLTSGSG
jgi:hypothetical protein